MYYNICIKFVKIIILWPKIKTKQKPKNNKKKSENSAEEIHL